MRTLVFLCSLFLLAFSVVNLHRVLPIPITLQEFSPEVIMVLKELKVPEDRIKELASSISLASRITGFSPTLLASLAYTESGFSLTAVSKKGYKGIMQTPYATKKYTEIDVLLGARILEEKYKIAKGDMHLALALYKGGDNPLAHRQAKEVIVLCLKLQEKQRRT